MALTPFHLAFPVTDIQASRNFYVDVLGASVGRSAERWIDFDFYGHQISAHLVDEALASDPNNPVDGDTIPVRHFGVVLAWNDWQGLQSRIEQAGVQYRLRPKIRFAGEPGEQGTFFIDDPSGNVLEFKSFRDFDRIFASN